MLLQKRRGKHVRGEALHMLRFQTVSYALWHSLLSI